MTRKEALAIAKPILFNTDMVCAIQDGRKTVTRRVIKVPETAHMFLGINPETVKAEFLCGEVRNGLSADWEIGIKLPYQIGDILYIRETWAKIGDWIDVDPEVGIFDGYIYKSSWADGEEHPAWRPSIHMPKEAARIFLRVTNIKVERLQDIDEIGVINEGAEPLIRCPQEHIEYYPGGQEMCWNVLPCAVECDKP